MTTANGVTGRPSGFQRLGTAARRAWTPVRDFMRRHQSLSVIVLMALTGVALPLITLVPPFSTFQAESTWLNNFTLAGIYVLLALGLNIVVGLAGLLDLGYAAFFAIGSYTYAFGASSFSGVHIPFWPMLLVGAVVAAIFGVLLGAPTLRLRGDYLAIVTLGFGEIVPIVFRNSDTYTRGTNGISGLDPPAILNYEFKTIEILPFYVVMLGILTIVMILVYRLQDSRLGRSWMAIREDELAAASNGINTVTTKLLAFALGASTAGLAGVFSASKLTFSGPDQFTFGVSFTVLAMVVLGGMGNNWGVAAGAFVLYMIQNVLLKGLNQFFDAVHVPLISDIDFLHYQFLLYGIALVLMMLWRPEGLFPSRRRRRELHSAEKGGEELVTPAEESSGGLA
jgi:ABC-type branched-subunit amino acid transport system permease subunit